MGHPPITDNITADRSANYIYDQLNRIASAQSTGTDCTPVPTNTNIDHNWGNTYTLDAWGNLTAKTVTKCRSEWLSASIDVNNHFNSTGFGYDVAGNLTSNGGATYSYDAENRISTTAGVTYLYDGDGVRVKKSGGSSSPTLYWGESFALGPIAETDLSGTIKAEYVYFGGKRIARRDSAGVVHYYFSDHLNSVNLVYSADGTKEEDSDFYPYGGERGYTLGSGNHFKFTGKERDTESGLDYFGARYYGNSLGRFLTPDWADAATAVPFAEFQDPQTLNLYGYVRNNPFNRRDPVGHVGQGDPPTLNDVLDIVEVKASVGPSVGVEADLGPGGTFKAGASAEAESSIGLGGGNAQTTIGAGGELSYHNNALNTNASLKVDVVKYDVATKETNVGVSASGTFGKSVNVGGEIKADKNGVDVKPVAQTKKDADVKVGGSVHVAAGGVGAAINFSQAGRVLQQAGHALVDGFNKALDIIRMKDLPTFSIANNPNN